MQKLKNFLLSIFFFFIFCILGIIVGVSVGYGILILDANGMFSSWEPLDGNQQFEKIVSADIQTVWARATDGKVYSWNTNCYRENCNQWIEAKEIPEDPYGSDSMFETLKISASCDFDDSFRKAPGHVIECAHVVVRMADFGMTVDYALLNDGEIWMWKKSSSNIGFELAPLFGTFLGIIIGLSGFIVFMTRRATKNKKSSASPV